MAVSEKIDNTVDALSIRAAAGELTFEEFRLGMAVLRQAAADVRQLEANQIPAALTLTDDQLADGKVVRLPAKTGSAA